MLGRETRARLTRKVKNYQARGTHSSRTELVHKTCKVGDKIKMTKFHPNERTHEEKRKTGERGGTK